MVSRSGIAHGICLGRSTNNRIYWIGNWRKQHQRRSEHNNQQHLDARLSERYCRNTRRGGWSNGRVSWPDERHDRWTIYYNHHPWQ